MRSLAAFHRVNVTENRIAASTSAERKTKIGGWEKSDLTQEVFLSAYGPPSSVLDTYPLDFIQARNVPNPIHLVLNTSLVSKFRTQAKLKGPTCPKPVEQRDGFEHGIPIIRVHLCIQGLEVGIS